MSLPYLPFYVGDYLRDTRHLSTVEHGAYLLLIMQYWAQGVLPDDDAQLARIAGMSAAGWRKVRPVIQSFFRDGWHHKHIDAELAKAEARSAKARKAANERHHGDAPSMAGASSEQQAGTGDAMPRDCHPEPYPKPKDSLLAAGAAESAFERFWAAYPKRHGGNPRKPAREIFKSKVVRRGVDPEAIIAGAKAYRAEMQTAGNVGTRFVQMAKAWLSEERWNDYETAPIARPPMTHYNLVDHTAQCDAWRTYYERHPTPSHQFRLREMASCFAKGAPFPVPSKWPPSLASEAA